MPTPYFQFKQFTVWHDQCAMKVGTDGVLLGAWAPADSACSNILDVGCGSGLVALMLAQRCPQALVTAVDIDEGAYRQSELNFRQSPWSSRLRAVHSPVRHFRPDQSGYDLIVSNPPFFTHSLKTPQPARTTARHNDTLPLTELLVFAAGALKKTGSIVLILPVTDKEKCVKLAESLELFCSRSLTVIPKPGAAPKRVLLVLGRENSPEETGELTIETEKRGVYSPQFSALVRDFYLKL